ncbi:hypothetical protein [Caldisericum sp.]|uniref:hypothetical protein n=1 Tax=Caldisericum sp. TaxID=2499687 RepID=UPI003D0DA1A3
MVKYTETKPVLLKLPKGIYDNILEIMKVENSWLTPQDFIKEAIKEKIERWKKEHPGHP